MPIDTLRRTPAMAMDADCVRLDACPAIPAEGIRKPLTGGWIVDKTTDSVLERWRLSADGSVREYYKFKTDPLARKQCPWTHVWWVN